MMAVVQARTGIPLVVLVTLATSDFCRSSAAAYAPSNRNTQLRPIVSKCKSSTHELVAPLATAAAIFGALISPDPAAASSTAARIQINSIPPSSVLIDDSLPVIGKALSGTYARIDSGAANAVGKALGGELSKPQSVTIRSPVDKVAAIQELATKGKLEFDIAGIVETHIDVELGTPRPGELEVLVESPLIPKLPIKNKITDTEQEGTKTPKRGKKSDWSAVTNLGDGSVLYTNSKTGVTQKEMPTDI